MSELKPSVLFEDKSVLILSKPSDWVVNEAQTTKHLKVIQGYLAKNFNYLIAKNKELRSGIVHRIDKETSGVLIVAKTQDIMENLQAQFKARKVKKTYLALVHGRVEPQEGEITVPVGRLSHNRKRFGIVPGGKKAKTNYEVINYYKDTEGREYSLVKAKPVTGRTHQIRVHLKYLGYPLVSDEFYTGRKTAKRDRTWCPRLFLHAQEIEFTHPETGKKVHFKSKLSEDLEKALARLASLQ